MWLDLLVALILGGGIVALGMRHAVLRLSGAICGLLTVLAVIALTDWTWVAPLLVVLAVLVWLGGFGAEHKREVLHQARAQQLTWEQMLHRLGWPLLMAFFFRLLGPHDGYYAAFLGALAVALADWAGSELGLLSAQPPRNLVSGRATRAGAAGAISVLGTVAALAAAWLVGLAALLASMTVAWLGHEDLPRAYLWLPLAAMIAGTLGSLLDSFLGASAQGIYYCEGCERYSEEPIPDCGRQAVPIRGWSWLTNNLINWVSGIVGSAVMVTLTIWLAHSTTRW